MKILQVFLVLILLSVVSNSKDCNPPKVDSNIVGTSSFTIHYQIEDNKCNTIKLGAFGATITLSR